MPIKSVEVRNFKRFQHLKVELGHLDCLTGANNSGKTTLLQALALFGFCTQLCLHRKNGDLQLRRRSIGPEDFYVLPVTHPMDIFHDRRAMDGRKQRRVQLTTAFEDGLEVEATIKLDFNRFSVSVKSSSPDQAALMRLAEFHVAYLPVFSMFQPREERRLQAALEDELIRGRVNSVIRNLLLDLQEKQQLDELIGILRRNFPGLENLNVEFDAVTDRFISVTYREKSRPRELDIFSAGSGFQQFLYLFGFILLRNPSLVLLDEPDVHLHGTLQGGLLDELKRLTAAGKQVILATHSRELISRVGPESIIWVDEGVAQRQSVSFDVYDALDRLGSLDPTQLALVQAYRRVIVVENRSDRDLIGILLSKCLPPDVWPQIERRLAFCYSKGNPWKQQRMSELRFMLQQLMGVSGRPLEMFVVADSDYHPDLGSLRESLNREPNMKWHVWQRAEIENYLLVAPAIMRLFGSNPEQPTLWDQSFQAEYERLLESTHDTVHDKLVQAFEELRRQRSESWTAATMSRRAREHLQRNWQAERLALADAKDAVLPGLKRWFQSIGLGQFSDRQLAEEIQAKELPDEMRQLAGQLVAFAGLRPPRR